MRTVIFIVVWRDYFATARSAEPGSFGQR